jgi:DNA-binding transcriptional LysR family regulator
VLDAGRLVTLRAVASHGSLSAAAHALHLTQPAVSRQIAVLERQLGTPLLRRTSRGAVLTEAGRLLSRHADEIVARLERAERDVRELAGLDRGTVRLGSFFSALVHLSAELAAALTEDHPGLAVVDELVDRATALDRLRQGQLDLALVVEHDFEPAPPVDGVLVVDLFDDPLRVVLPAGHPCARRRSVPVRDLSGETWIRPHEGSAARRLDGVLARAGLQPDLLLAGRGDEPVEVQALVAAGRGVTLSHDLTVVVARSGVVIRPLAGDDGFRSVQVAVLPSPRPPSVEVALAALRAIGAAHRRRLARPVG